MSLLHQSAYSILTQHRFVRLLFGKTSQNWCSPGVVPQIPLEIRSQFHRICVLISHFAAQSASSRGYFPEPVYNFFLLGRLGINVHRGLNVFMPHDRLDDLQVSLFFAKPCAERVPQMMCRKVRQQNRFAMLLLCFCFLARIVVCNDAFNGTAHTSTAPVHFPCDRKSGCKKPFLKIFTKNRWFTLCSVTFRP